MPPLGRLFSRLHSASYHCYADNTRVCFSAQPDKHEATIISSALLFKFQRQRQNLILLFVCLKQPVPCITLLAHNKIQSST